MDLADTLNAAARRGSMKSLMLVATRDGRWQASRENPDGSFAIRVAADPASAVTQALEAWSSAPPVSGLTNDNPDKEGIFS